VVVAEEGFGAGFFADLEEDGGFAVVVMLGGGRALGVFSA
jgi:hypothetical protein